MVFHSMNGERTANTDGLSSNEWETHGKYRLSFQKRWGIPIKTSDDYPPHSAIGLTLLEDEYRGLHHCPHHLLCHRPDCRG